METFRIERRGMMKKILSLIFIVAFWGLIGSCAPGEIVGELRGASFKTTDVLNIDQPLKIDKKDFLTIKKIAIISWADILKDPDSKRLNKTMIDVLISELDKSKRFELVSPYTFKRKQDELGIKIDPSIMTNKDLEDAVAEIGSALNCDAILSIGVKVKKTNMAAAFFNYGLFGKIDEPMTAFLDVSSNKNGKTIWIQTHDIIYSTGGVGLKNTPNDELRNMVIPVVKPLSDNFLNSFDR